MISARKQRDRLRVGLGDEFGGAEAAEVKIADIAGEALNAADPEGALGNHFAAYRRLCGVHRLAIRSRRRAEAGGEANAEMGILADTAKIIG